MTATSDFFIPPRVPGYLFHIVRALISPTPPCLPTAWLHSMQSGEGPTCPIGWTAAILVGQAGPALIGQAEVAFSYNKGWTNVAASKVALVFLLAKLNGFPVVHVWRKLLINQLYKSSCLTRWAYFLRRWTGNLLSLGRNHMLPGVDREASCLSKQTTCHLVWIRKPLVSQHESHDSWGGQILDLFSNSRNYISPEQGTEASSLSEGTTGHLLWTRRLPVSQQEPHVPGVDRKASYLTAGLTTHLGRPRRPPVSQKEQQHATWPEVGSYFCLSSGTQAAWVYIHICSLEC